MPNYYDSLNSAVSEASGHGQYGDTTLMHVNPAEVEGLGQFLGRPLTRNPVTGYPEAYWWLPWMMGAAGGIIGGATGDWKFKNIAAGFGLGYMGGAGLNSAMGSPGGPLASGEGVADVAEATKETEGGGIMDWMSKNKGKTAMLGLGAASLLGGGGGGKEREKRPFVSYEEEYGRSPSWRQGAQGPPSATRMASATAGPGAQYTWAGGQGAPGYDQFGGANPYEEERRRSQGFV